MKLIRQCSQSAESRSVSIMRTLISCCVIVSGGRSQKTDIILIAWPQIFDLARLVIAWNPQNTLRHFTRIWYRLYDIHVEGIYLRLYTLNVYGDVYATYTLVRRSVLVLIFH